MNSSMSPGTGLMPPSMMLHGSSKVQHILEWIFLVLQVVGGQIGLGALLGTFLILQKQSTRRCIVVLNFCFTWLISSVSYSLLLYTERSDPTLFLLNPGDSLCLVQAALINASQVMTSVSTLALIINLWLTLMWPYIYMNGSQKRVIKACLVFVAYVAFFIMFAVAYAIGSTPVSILNNLIAPNLAIPSPLYCIIVGEGPPTNSVKGVFRILLSSYIFSTVIYGITFLIEAHLLWSIRRKRLHDSAENAAYRETFNRILVFSFYRVISLIMMAFVIHQPSEIILEGLSSKLTIYDGFSEIIQAGLPFVAFLLLGTRTDVLNSWGLKTRKTSIEIMKVVDRSRLNSTKFQAGKDTVQFDDVWQKGSIMENATTGLSLKSEEMEISSNQSQDSIIVGSAHTDIQFPRSMTDRDLPPLPVVLPKTPSKIYFWMTKPR